MLSGSFSLLVEPNGAYGNGCKQTITDNNQGITDTRVMSDVGPGHWSEWKTLATATPPQEFDLPLADGFSAAQPCTYWKNQFGAVTIGGTAEKSNGVADLTTIATLPESFRPAKNVERPATLSGGGSRYAGSVLIGSNGSVRIHTPTTANVVTFAATFLAAD